MYAQGLGVQQDFGQALIWFRKSADQGDELAQFFLGVMYRDGNGVWQDKSQALAWYRKSADQGFLRCSILARYIGTAKAFRGTPHRRPRGFAKPLTGDPSTRRATLARCTLRAMACRRTMPKL